MTDRCPPCQAPASRIGNGRPRLMECQACGLAFRHIQRASRPPAVVQPCLWADDDAPSGLEPAARIDAPKRAG